MQDEKRRYWEKLEETTRNLKVAHGAVKEKESELDRIKHEVSQHEEDKVVLKEKHEYVISEKNRKGEELRASKQELAALQLELNRAEEQFNKAIVGLESQKTELQTSLLTLNKKYTALQDQREKDRATHQAEIDLLTRHQNDSLQSHDSNIALLEEQYLQSSARDKAVADKALLQQKEAAQKQLNSLQQALDESERSFGESMAQLEKLRVDEKERGEKRLRDTTATFEAKLASAADSLDTQREEMQAAQAELRQQLLLSKQEAADAAADARRRVDAANNKEQESADKYNALVCEVALLREQIQQAQDDVEYKNLSHRAELDSARSVADRLQAANTMLREEASEALAVQKEALDQAATEVVEKEADADVATGAGAGARADPAVVEDLKKRLESSKLLVENTMKRLSRANAETRCVQKCCSSSSTTKRIYCES